MTIYCCISHKKEAIFGIANLQNILLCILCYSTSLHQYISLKIIYIGKLTWQKSKKHRILRVNNHIEINLLSDNLHGPEVIRRNRYKKNTVVVVIFPLYLTQGFVNLLEFLTGWFGNKDRFLYPYAPFTFEIFCDIIPDLVIFYIIMNDLEGIICLYQWGTESI